MSLRMPSVCDLVSVWVFRSGSSHPLTYSVFPAHTAADATDEIAFDDGSGTSLLSCAEAVRGPISATAKSGRCLIVILCPCHGRAMTSGLGRVQQSLKRSHVG